MADDTTPPMAKPRVAAGALFFDSGGRILLVKPTYKERWDIPGGYVEPNETPLEACRREVREELSLTPTLGSLLAVDWAPSDAEGDKVLFVFDGGEIGQDELAKVSLEHDEISEFRFADRSLFTELLTDRLDRRLSAAVAAKQAGKVVYLENGNPTA